MPLTAETLERGPGRPRSSASSASSTRPASPWRRRPSAPCSPPGRAPRVRSRGAHVPQQHGLRHARRRAGRREPAARASSRTSRPRSAASSTSCRRSPPSTSSRASPRLDEYLASVQEKGGRRGHGSPVDRRGQRAAGRAEAGAEVHPGGGAAGRDLARQDHAPVRAPPPASRRPELRPPPPARPSRAPLHGPVGPVAGPSLAPDLTTLQPYGCILRVLRSTP
jgi:hypothetical protein